MIWLSKSSKSRVNLYANQGGTKSQGLPIISNYNNHRVIKQKAYGNNRDLVVYGNMS